MRRPLIAGNWKMHKCRGEARTAIRRLDELAGRDSGPEILVFPPFTALDAVREAAAGTAVQWGAQNLHWEDSGAYTGEVSSEMLLDCGCSHVLIGHSERRQLFRETDDEINRKIRKALISGLVPVFCVGEGLEERESQRVEEVVCGQMERGLAGLTGPEISRIIIAYEPVWAIGTGKTATPETAQESHALIRAWLSQRCTGAQADGIRILYGGSVKASNIAGLMIQADIDGALVGGASLDPESFASIVRYNASSGASV